MTRVTRATPCPVCARPDWCLIAADKTACICQRVESGKTCGDAGYLHRLADPPPRAGRVRVLRVPAKATPPDLTALATKYQHAAPVERLHGPASSLSVRAESLMAFGVGWSADHVAWTFPMTDPGTGTITGRLRGRAGLGGGRATRADVEHLIRSADVRRPNFSLKLYPTAGGTK